MARMPRIHYPGALYHVLLRGNGGADIFFDDADRRHFVDLIKEGVLRYRHRIHAFCLMENHVSLRVSALYSVRPQVLGTKISSGDSSRALIPCA